VIKVQTATKTKYEIPKDWVMWSGRRSARSVDAALRFNTQWWLSGC
jgi:hypothetical protein